MDGIPSYRQTRRFWSSVHYMVGKSARTHYVYIKDEATLRSLPYDITANLDMVVYYRSLPNFIGVSDEDGAMLALAGMDVYQRGDLLGMIDQKYPDLKKPRKNMRENHVV